jgi:aspartyl-tRNA(Asn)/glutamyl-tRNA(Gln) amidotransferase subunit B
MEWETVIGLEIHVQLATRARSSPAPHRFGATEHAGLRDRSGNAGRAAGAERGGGAHGGALRSGHRRQDRSPLGVRPQELLLPRPAQGLPDQPIRVARRQQKWSVDRSTWKTAPARSSASPAPTWRKTPASRCTKTFRGLSGIDLNRAGTPLLEIVSEPELRSAKEAVAYMKKTALDGALSRHLRRQHGRRLVALRRQRVGAPQGRAEIRHPRRDQELNSFRFVERAINSSRSNARSS